MKKALILCSGGLDSVVTAHYTAEKKYKEKEILFFNYGQRGLRMERKFSKICAKRIGAEFTEIKLKELKKISTSLLNRKGKEKKISRKDLKDTKKESDRWYVPCRNSIFISYALAIAEADYIKSEKITDIFLGFHDEGREHYPDTTEDFVKSMNSVSKKFCNYPFKIMAPFIKKDKDFIVKMGKKLGVNFSETYSCYLGKKKSCGNCLNCALRKEAFYWANETDPLT